MSHFAEQIRKSAGLLDALQAVTHRKAFATLLVTIIVCGLLFFVTGLIASFFMGQGHSVMAGITTFLGFLVMALAGLIGASAAGYILNATVRNREEKSIGSALSFAVATVHRQLGVFLLMVIFVFLLALAVALLLLICKIPYLGPVLYVLVFPLCAAATGLTFYAMMFVLGLVGPAIWEGNTIMRTVALLWAIARTRLIAIIVQIFLLGLLVSLVSGIVFGVVFFGMSFITGLSMPILGQGIGMGGLGGALGMMAGAGSGHMIAAALGGAVLAGCAAVIPALVALAGNCIIFANTTEGLSAEDAERSIKGALDAAKEKADQVKRQLDEARQQSTQPSAPPTSPEGAVCPQCQSGIAPDDVFCGNCGHRLTPE
ncbi:MAG: zinc ribbon domain-containing protein [Zoogloeaceae bacterium]|jgi:hypothetical protein|nr:zinc ribbon domain-containing protein [Zoogloeaceae bacterium]